MNIYNNKFLIENYIYIKENVKQAKQYVISGKLSNEELQKLIQIDPTPTRKFVGWMAKQWIKGNIKSIDELSNYISEYNVFLEKKKVKTKDIYQFKTFDDLKREVDLINQSGDSLSIKDLESDYDTIIDNNKLLIISPHTHEASRKLGLTHFSYRDCDKDSAWCTTYKSPDHFNDYYYNSNITFYYIKVKSPEIIKNIRDAFPSKGGEYLVIAIAVSGDKKEGYDGKDERISMGDLEKYLKIIGIS